MLMSVLYEGLRGGRVLSSGSEVVIITRMGSHIYIVLKCGENTSGDVLNPDGYPLPRWLPRAIDL